MFEGGNKLERSQVGAVYCRQLIWGYNQLSQQRQTEQQDKLNTNNK